MEEEYGQGSNEGKSDDQNQADQNQTDDQNLTDDQNQNDDQNQSGEQADQPQADEQPKDAAQAQKEDAATVKVGTDLLTQALKYAGVTDPYAYVRTINKTDAKVSILTTLNGANYQVEVSLESNAITQVTIAAYQA